WLHLRCDHAWRKRTPPTESKPPGNCRGSDRFRHRGGEHLHLLRLCRSPRRHDRRERHECNLKAHLVFARVYRGTNRVEWCQYVTSQSLSIKAERESKASEASGIGELLFRGARISERRWKMLRVLEAPEQSQ